MKLFNDKKCKEKYFLMSSDGKKNSQCNDGDGAAECMNMWKKANENLATCKRKKKKLRE